MNKTVDYYNKNANNYFHSTVNANMPHIYRAYLIHLPPGGKILDAGCGSGRDSLYFLEKGYQVVAFDASVEMVKRSSQLIGQTVMLDTFEEFQWDDVFDGIWACASLLHVQEEHMTAAIENLARHLKPQGIFYMSFKYGEGDYEKEGRHFTCYQENSFDDLMSRVETLTIVEMFKTVDVRLDRPGEYWLNCILRKID